MTQDFYGLDVLSVTQQAV